MEQASNYLKWINTKHGQFIRHPLQYLPLSSAVNPTCDDSWEEQAFLEDTACALRGCVWPPRSYSCTFCRREFRSAQALGGHMNVHRRDRARLKQSPNLNNEIRRNTHEHNYQYQLDQHSLDQNLVFHQYPSHNWNQICTLLCIPNPNSHPISVAPSNSRTSSPNSRVSGALSPPNNNQDEKNLFPHLLSSSLIDKKRYGERDHEESKYLEDDLSISLSIVSRARPSSSSSEDDKEEAVMRLKRRKTDSSTIPFFLEPQSLVDVESNRVLRISPCTIDEQDLELRLGY